MLWEVEISYLLFVGDTLILCDAGKENLEHLSWVFIRFEACLRSKINLEKSELITLGYVSNMKELTEVLGCSVVVCQPHI